MTDQPCVSVILTFFNAERFILEAIESLFAQTYETWELLLVDDGSTDGSTAIAHRYAEKYPGKVRFLEHDGHQNKGTSASRNLGIANAQGVHIAFLDADDVWLPHKLEEQVAILEANPEAAMVYGLSQWWYSWTGDLDDSKRDFVHQLGVQPNTLIPPPTLISAFFFRQDASIPSPSDILVRYETIKRVGGWEDSFRHMYDDQALYAKICLTSPVFATDRRWTKYRQHPESCVSVTEKSGKAYETRLIFLDWLATYFSQQKVGDARIWQGLQTERWLCQHPKLHRIRNYFRRRIKRIKRWGKNSARRILRPLIYPLFRNRWFGSAYSPPVGWVRFGNLYRVTPVSREFGFERGIPIDRYYIDQFVSSHQDDIQGRVLEIGDDMYTRRFGNGRVSSSDVLYVTAGFPKATIVADLSHADHIPGDSFDCIILTQTLQFIYDVPAVISTLYRILKPGGVVLVTVPGISPISRYDMDRWGHYWSFTSLSMRRLFEEVFPTSNIDVEAHGNVLTASAFLYGLAVQELQQKDLDYCDTDYEVLITVRAVKPEEH